MRVINAPLLTTLTLVSVLAGCNSGGSKTTQPTKPTEPTETHLSSELDQQFFKQLSQANSAIKEQKIWSGYDYASIPQYFIFKKDELASKGFIVNPRKAIDGMERLGKNENQGLNIAKYDDAVVGASDKLKQGNGSFEFSYKIKDGDYYLQTYSENDVDVKHAVMTSAVALSVHENFHIYQSKRFKKHVHQTQLGFEELDKYPINEQSMALRLMMLHLFKQISPNMTEADKKTLLKHYIVLTKKLLEIDTTVVDDEKSGWVYKHGLGQERGEGSALYVDYMTEQSIFDVKKNQPIVKLDPFKLDTPESGWNINNRKGLNDYFGWTIFYDTGASAIWLLAQLGVDLKEIENGRYPYEVAVKHFPVDEVDALATLNQLQSEPSWQQAKDASKRYSVLLEK